MLCMSPGNNSRGDLHGECAANVTALKYETERHTSCVVFMLFKNHGNGYRVVVAVTSQHYASTATAQPSNL